MFCGNKVDVESVLNLSAFLKHIWIRSIKKDISVISKCISLTFFFFFQILSEVKAYPCSHFFKCLFICRTTTITLIEHCNTIWLNNHQKISMLDLPQQKLKTSRLACTGSGRSAVSGFAGGLSFTVALEVDKKKGNAVLRRRPSGSARRPSEPSITGARWQPPSPPAPGSPSSSSPTSPRSRCLSAPISLPSVMLREEFYSCCQLIVRARALNTCTHARTFATTATTHTGMSALG